jgi:hypothetical protein
VPRKENWRDAAALAAAYHADLVLTASKPAVGFPYFESRGITVRQWNPLEGDTQEIAREEILRRHRIWIIDTVTNAGYHDDLRRWAEDSQFDVTEKQLDTDGFASLRLLLVVDPNP